MKHLFTTLFLLITGILLSQTVDERNHIISKSNTEQGSLLKKQFDGAFIKDQAEVKAFLSNNPQLKNKERLQRFIDGWPIFYHEDFNEYAAETIKANSMYPSGTLGLSVTGQGITLGIWEAAGGKVRNTHVEFGNRVELSDGASNLIAHASHVMGTMIASGVSPSRRGIAYQANAKAYDSTNDNSEILDFASQGYLVSNHSYGNLATSLPESAFGAYGTQAVEVDQIMNAYPYYQYVKSAGNDRSSTTLNQTILKGGYDLINGSSTAKNVITVAAINGVDYDATLPPDYNPNNISSFSSFGPTDDGRIKPDIASKGVAVNSCISNSNNAYGFLQGTSMAAPGITGLIGLLQKHYNNLNTGTYMKSATVRGLLCQSATEAGDYDGPDYIFGWGIADGLKAANIITNRGTSAILDENNLTNGQTFTRNITINSTQNLNVLISWTDPTGIATSTLDNRSPRLINNLDLKVIKDGTTYYPWKLDPDAVLSPPTNTSDNNVDNLERVQIYNATPGTYTIQVTHKGTLQSGSQDYTLVASGTGGLSLNTSNFAADNNFFVYPNPATNVLSFHNPNSIELSSIVITDIAGKQLITRNNINSNDIEVSSLQSGVYFITFTTDAKSFVKKFIKN